LLLNRTSPFLPSKRSYYGRVKVRDTSEKKETKMGELKSGALDCQQVQRKKEKGEKTHTNTHTHTHTHKKKVFSSFW